MENVVGNVVSLMLCLNAIELLCLVASRFEVHFTVKPFTANCSLQSLCFDSESCQMNIKRRQKSSETLSLESF